MKRNYDNDFSAVSHVVYIDAGHTTNGNPRRGWIVFDADRIAGFIQEDFSGRGGMREELAKGGYVSLDTINGEHFKIEVSTKTFNLWKKAH